MSTYSQKLNSSLIRQSQSEVFYMGLIEAAEKNITREICEILDVDRSSIWIYSKDGSFIELQELYVKAENTHYQNISLYRKDFEPYFLALEDNPIIIACDAETHPATACFSETYLKPLGIVSMLDVPIWYRGSLLGVICIENQKKKEWTEEEVSYAQIMSSLYSFAHSVRQSNILNEQIQDSKRFLDASAIVSTADAHGKITYVNQKFVDISGYTLEEAIGKDHNVVNSGIHPKEFWAEMYKTVVCDKKVWNAVVTNRAKNGDLYHVDTFIKAEFDADTGKLTGFTSIRQDVTDIVQTNDKLNSLVASQTSYVLRTDMQGRHTYWNQKFEEEFGWVYEGDMYHGDSLLSICESHHGAAHETVMKCIKEPGKIIKVELDKPHRDGSRRTTLWEFVCLTDKTGKPTEIQCMGIDITDRVKAEREIEKKNTYLEHAAKILRHDMHSGINTYIPRGVSSLERRLSEEQQKELKIEAPLKMIKEGLKHTQKVYKGVYEFTNLVKKDVVLTREDCDLKKILEEYLSATAYRSHVKIEELGTASVNEPLFCTAIDNLIRNGLRYNDSDAKIVTIKKDGSDLLVEDNGRGMSSEDFKELSKPYTRREGQKESGTGLGLNICLAILEEHAFGVTCNKLPQGGTQIRIKIE